MKKDLIIWGATGQCIVLEEFLNKDYNIVALFDKNENIDSPFIDVPIYHNEEIFFHFCGTKKNLHFIVAIGGNNGNLRREISQDLIQKKIIPISAIHPKANVSSNAIIGLSIKCFKSSASSSNLSAFNQPETFSDPTAMALLLLPLFTLINAYLKA